MDSNQLLLPQHTQFKVIPQPDSSQSLEALANNLKSGLIVSPHHQRDRGAWNRVKQQAWVDRCRKVAQGTAQQPLGVVCVYTLTSEGCRQQYLNEGLQRISTTACAMSCPGDFGLLDEQEARAIFGRVFVSVQNRQYESHQQASEDFVLVNQGEGLDPLEKHRHIIVYAPEFPNWKPFLENWQRAVDSALSPFSKTTQLRKGQLGRERSVNHLLCVSMTGGPSSFGSGNELELALRDSFSDRNPQLVVPQCIKKMQDYAAEIDYAWRQCQQDTRILMQDGLARWCLGVMLKNRDRMTPKGWHNFLTKVFDRTKGKGLLNFEHEKSGEPDSITLTNKLDCFNRVCKLLEIEHDGDRPRERGSDLLRPGFHSDHIKPFADYGNGQTEPLPARLNAAKAARTSI